MMGIYFPITSGQLAQMDMSTNLAREREVNSVSFIGLSCLLNRGHSFITQMKTNWIAEKAILYL